MNLNYSSARRPAGMLQQQQKLSELLLASSECSERGLYNSAHWWVHRTYLLSSSPFKIFIAVFISFSPPFHTRPAPSYSSETDCLFYTSLCEIMPTGSTLVLTSQSFVKPLFSLFYEYTFVSSIPPSFPLPKPVSYPSYPLSILSDAPTFTWACGYNALYKRPSSFLSVRRDLFWNHNEENGSPKFWIPFYLRKR